MATAEEEARRMSLIVADKWSHGGWQSGACEGTALVERLSADAGDHDFVAKGCSFSALAGTAFELAGVFLSGFNALLVALPAGAITA